VIVHDRYQNYDAKIFATWSINSACKHLIRDCQDAAKRIPRRIGRSRSRALQGLIHAANLARAGTCRRSRRTSRIADQRYRHGVRIGLKDVARVPDASSRNTGPLLEDFATANTTSCGSPPISDPATSNQANVIYDRRKPSRRSPAGSPAEPTCHRTPVRHPRTSPP